MQGFDLLSAVQPDDGVFVAVGIKDGKPPLQLLSSTREDFDRHIAALVAQGRNAFYGVAKYKSVDGGRTKDDVLALKAFWLDIDCGEDKAAPGKDGRAKGYLTQEIALRALRDFYQNIGLPDPIVVNSGRGLHVYWPLTEPISREEWEPVAARLRELCLNQDLLADTVAFEAARVLRVPGTFNFKGDEPLPVEVIAVGEPVELANFRDLIGVREAPVFVPAPSRELSYLGKKFAEDRVKSFKKIVKGTGSSPGCAQLVECLLDAALLSEPRWFDALSVAKFCVDRDEAVFALSAEHGDYDPHKTEQKMRGITAPHYCVTFERNNPGGCSGCPHQGSIKSPISLGVKVLPATSNEVQFTLEPVEGEEQDAEPEPEVYQVPDYPFPYFRGQTGGIYLRSENEEETPKLIYPHDLYVLKRMRDPNLGDVTVMRLHLPLDGMRQFVVPNHKMVDPAELRKALAAEGVVCQRKHFEALINFLYAMVTDLQGKKKAEEMRLQFGWADKHRKFIIGDTEVTALGNYHSPPSSATAAYAYHMHSRGTLDNWKKIFALYGEPGLEPVAFAALTAFGAPLFHMSGQKGIVINMIHPRSGTGKTTALRMCNSVWGSPDGLVGAKDDTPNARIQRMGTFNNLPVTYDEMTNIHPAALSDFVYNMTHGKGKDRMKASTNEIRHNATTWQTMALTSSNASFYERIGAYKHASEGESMRILEYLVDFKGNLNVEEGKHYFDHMLLENYGHAGISYAEYLVKNYEQVKRTYLQFQAQLDRIGNIHQNERYRSGAVAANLTGGHIAKNLGLIDWDLTRIAKWAKRLLTDLREDHLITSVDLPSEVVSRYINRFRSHMLVIQSPDPSGLQRIAENIPPHSLLMRYEPDTQRLFMTAKHFQEDCVNLQINYRDTINQLKANGACISVGSRRLGTGLKNYPATVVNAIELDLSHPVFTGFIDELNDPEGGEDAGGGG